METASNGYKDARKILEDVAAKAVRRGRTSKGHPEDGKQAAFALTDQQSKLLEASNAISG